MEVKRIDNPGLGLKPGQVELQVWIEPEPTHLLIRLEMSTQPEKKIVNQVVNFQVVFRLGSQVGSRIDIPR